MTKKQTKEYIIREFEEETKRDIESAMSKIIEELIKKDVKSIIIKRESERKIKSLRIWNTALIIIAGVAVVIAFL